MVSLADLNTTASTAAPTLKDFGPWVAGQPKTATINPDTATNIAAHGALLAQPDQVLSAYGNISTELSAGNASATLTNITKDREALDQKSTYASLQTALADPNIDPATKAKYLDGYVNLGTGPSKDSLSVTVAKQAALSPSSPNETDEAVHTIVPLDNSVYDGVDKYNGWVQKQINLSRNSTDDNWVSKSLDVLHTIVPFVNQINTAINETKLGAIKNPGDLLKTFTLLGNSKGDVRQAIQSMPVKDRYDLAQKVLDVVNSTNGSLGVNPDTLARIDQLNSYLGGGGYNNKDQISDNIFSLMDSVFFVGPLVKAGIKGPLEAVQAASALKRADLAEQAAKATEPEIQQIVKPLLLTYDKPKPTVFVDRAGGASTNLADVGSPSNETVAAAHDLITDRIMEKFNKTDKKAQFYPGDNPSVNMASIRDDVHEKVASILTPTTYNDPDIVKKVVDGVGDTLKGRFVETNKTFKPTASQLVRQSFDESNVNRLSTRTTVDHLSPSQTVKNYNPEKARNIDQMMVDDTSGQAAKALYGTTRDEAIANDFLPEVENVDGSVRNKVNMDVGPEPSQTVINQIKETKGRIDLTDPEKAAMRNVAKQDFGDVVGMVPRTSMGTVGDTDLLVKEGSEDTPHGVKFSMVYGPKDGEFKDKGQALRQALFSLRKYGVTPNEVELLGKTPEGFVSAGGKDFPSYMVRVNHDYEFTPLDTVERTLMGNSKWNLFDSRVNFTDGHMGSLSQHFIPPSVTTPATIFNASSVAADKSAWYGKKLYELLADYGKKFNGLTKRQKALVDDYRVEANNKGIKFNVQNLQARGLNDKAVETLKDWKTTTDTLHWMENVDVNKTARNRGWWRFVNQTSDTDLMVKPLPNHGFGEGAKVWDDTKGAMVTLKKSDIDALYERGGSIAKTRNTVEHPTATFDHILVENHSESSYVRRIRDEDNTLPYRDGYYPIKYKDTHFIEQTLKSADGTVYKKAVATAGNLSDAKATMGRLQAADNAAVYNIRGDYKVGSSSFDEANWSYLHSSGRSAQRVRGRLLEDGTKITDPDHVHIESPEESMVHAIRSVANRTAYRDWVDTTKDRWMAQYGHLIDDQAGVKMWPEDARMIGKDKLQTSNMEVRDAKATWRYVRSMEAGYNNLIDDASKNFFRNFANIAGNSKSWKWLEGPLNNAAKIEPTGFARRKAFRLLLAANPVRQAAVQASQALPVLVATNPLAIPKVASQAILLDYMRMGGDANSWMKAIARNTTGLSEADATLMFKHWQQSGFEAAVEANSLIRNQISTIIDRSLLGKVQHIAAKPLNIGQKYGFNVGENTLMKNVWLSEYDLLKKTGVKIDAQALDNLTARVRNLTGNMNKAGELPYNENMFSAALQFFQAPHKAFSQVMMGHKGLSGADRLKLGAAYVTTFGIGMSPVTSILSNLLPNEGLDPNARELIEGGLFNLAMNTALSNIFKQVVKTDFSDSFRLLQFPDVGALWHGMMTNGIGQTLASGASMGLVLGDNARVTNFVKQLMRPFTVPDDQKPAELIATAKSFLAMFSGTSNIFKAIYALKFHQSMSATGKVSDYHINDVEAVFKAAGFSTIDEIHQYASNNASYAATSAFKDDIAHIVDEISRRLAARDVSEEDSGWYMDMMAEAQKVYNNDPTYMAEFSNQIMYKARGGENSIFTTLLKQMGFTSAQDFHELVVGSHLSPEFQKTLLDAKDQFEEMKNAE